jgi:hypothetical protein
VTEIFALGTTEPVGSVTTPINVPAPVSWAETGLGERVANKRMITDEVNSGRIKVLSVIDYLQ